MTKLPDRDKVDTLHAIKTLSPWERLFVEETLECLDEREDIGQASRTVLDEIFEKYVVG